MKPSVIVFKKKCRGPENKGCPDKAWGTQNGGRCKACQQEQHSRTSKRLWARNKERYRAGKKAPREVTADAKKVARAVDADGIGFMGALRMVDMMQRVAS